VLEAQIARADRRIDALVFEVYGLTADEIKIIEEGTAPRRCLLPQSAL
jgi:hypothetical protein